MYTIIVPSSLANEWNWMNGFDKLIELRAANHLLVKACTVYRMLRRDTTHESHSSINYCNEGIAQQFNQLLHAIFSSSDNISRLHLSIFRWQVRYTYLVWCVILVIFSLMTSICCVFKSNHAGIERNFGCTWSQLLTRIVDQTKRMRIKLYIIKWLHLGATISDSSVKTPISSEKLWDISYF